ncbi:hypothetical protein VNO80_30394 [Phaseolus coccineus]|uniref:Uncharacterized protein n=1 Tax=Phaseolus coccineus TaxID=3886 RepID=A0AAN9QJG4_PHACN
MGSGSSNYCIGDPKRVETSNMSIIIKDAENSLLMCRETIVLQPVEKNNLECIAEWLQPVEKNNLECIAEWLVSKAACIPDCAGLTLSGILLFFSSSVKALVAICLYG